MFIYCTQFIESCDAFNVSFIQTSSPSITRSEMLECYNASLCHHDLGVKIEYSMIAQYNMFL